MRSAGLILSAGLALAAGPPVLAQEIGVEQIGAGSAAISVDQISGPAAGASRAATTLGSGSADRLPPAYRAPAVQLAPEGRPTAEAGPQLTAAQPSADAPTAGTRRVQGRDTTADALAGDDRCDPQARENTDDRCARVIETRSGEFRAPETSPLSPEQRLLIAQRAPQDRPRDVSDAARRLGNGELDDSDASLAIASLALAQPIAPPEEKRPEEAMPSVTDAIVAGIVSMMGIDRP